MPNKHGKLTDEGVLARAHKRAAELNAEAMDENSLGSIPAKKRAARNKAKRKR